MELYHQTCPRLQRGQASLSCCRVRVYDRRLAEPVICLSGHSSPLTTVQMDDWKVVSGSQDGLLCVWDQRMVARLWDVHNRFVRRIFIFHFSITILLWILISMLYCFILCPSTLVIRIRLFDHTVLLICVYAII